MTRQRVAGVLVALVCGVCSVSPARSQVLAGSFSATPPAFSPDGDTINDTTSLRFSLADTALVLSLIVFAADSVTPVDTLLAPAPDSTLGIRTDGWDGRAWDGSPAPEGAYVATLFARSQSMQDTTVSIPLFVDVTPPSLQIVGVSPALYVPGLPGHPSTLTLTVALASISPVLPGRVPDELQWEIRKPDGSVVPATDLEGRLSFDPPLLGDNPPSVGADGTYLFRWDAGGQSGLDDGIYRIGMVVVDAAGYTHTDSAVADFDVDLPRVSFTNVAGGAKLRVLPDSLFGWAWDRSGIDSLAVRYAAASPYRPLAAWTVRSDTAFFGVPLADSIASEGLHEVTIRATDGTAGACAGCPGRSRQAKLEFTWDATPPVAPVLDPVGGTRRTGSVTLSGDAPSESDGFGVVRIYRGGVKVDSVFVSLGTRFEKTVALLPGVNVFTATYADGARNESPPSNAVTVIFDDGAGFFMPAPFRRGDEFVVNLRAPAQGVEIRVYDLVGDLVVVLVSNATLSGYAIEWNGMNASGEAVKKGPLVAVATVRLQDGGSRRFRELFLLEDGE